MSSQRTATSSRIRQQTRSRTAAAAALVLVGSLSIAGAPAASAAPPVFVKTLAGPAFAEVYPSGLEYDVALNRLVVADTGMNRIVFYASTGRKTGEFGRFGRGDGEFDTPRDVAIDSASNIYVADAANHRIQKFDRSGNHLWSVGGLGSCNACLNRPIGLSWDGTNNVLLVASTVQSLIKAFDATGAWKWTSPSGGKLNIARPRDVIRGPDGRIWVADYKHHQVKAFPVTSAGWWWTTAPAISLGDGRISFPYNIVFSPDGDTAYVADTGNDRVARWDISGASPQWLSQLGQKSGHPRSTRDDAGKFQYLRRVAVDAAGNIFAADFWGNSIQRFSPTGSVISQIAGAPAPLPGFAQVYGVAVGPDGTLYAMDRMNARIERFDASGKFLNAAGARGAGAGRLSWAEAVAVAPDGYVWVADTRNERIQRWPADLADSPSVPSYGSRGSAVGQFKNPEGIAVDPAGKVWIADTRNHRLQIYDPTTGTFSVLGSRGSGLREFEGPQGVGVSSDAVYIADTGNNRIMKLALDGSFLAQFSGVTAPEGVALAADGSLWIADSGMHRVLHLTAGMADLGDTFGSQGSGDLQFFQPHSLAVHGSTLYVADTYNHRIQVFDTRGHPTASR